MHLISLLGFFIIASTVLFPKSSHHVNAYSIGVRNSPLGMTSDGNLRRDPSFIYSSLKGRADPGPAEKKAPKEVSKKKPEPEPKKEPKQVPKKEQKPEPKQVPKQVPKQEPKQEPNPKKEPVAQSTPPSTPSTPADDEKLPETQTSTTSAKTAGSKPTAPASSETVKSVNDQSQYKNSDSGASESVPTEPISWTTIIVLTSIGGLIIVAATLFACLRRKKRREMANNIVATSSVAWEQQNNAYEKMEEEDEPPSLGSFTVIASYIPSLDDELAIQPGDKVTILVEYDDGWVNGINESRGGAKGVFPRHCVDMHSVLNDKRSSSMAYTMVNLN